MTLIEKIGKLIVLFREKYHIVPTILLIDEITLIELVKELFKENYKTIMYDILIGKSIPKVFEMNIFVVRNAVAFLRVTL